MNSNYPFGNTPDKISFYKKFWVRAEVPRPLIGFTYRGFFPREEFLEAKSWKEGEYLKPEMVKPEKFIDDHVELIKEGEEINDDIIRGDSPASAVIPWLSGMLGSELKILPGNVAGEEIGYPWDEALNIVIEDDNEWRKKYLNFSRLLSDRSNGRFPVSHGAFRGPSDMHALLRGTEQSIHDLYETPERSKKLLERLSDIFIKITKDIWDLLPLFKEGFFDGMYQLWAPSPIARLQEDISSIYSPDLYREFLLSADRKIASSFPSCFIHLHPSSLFLLEEFLKIQELSCFQVNYEENSLSIDELIPYYKKIQDQNRSLLIRGKLNTKNIRKILKNIEYRGLYLLILVKNEKEIKEIKSVIKDETGEEI